MFKNEYIQKHKETVDYFLKRAEKERINKLKPINKDESREVISTRPKNDIVSK